MLPEVGATELLVIAAIALIVVGPKDLPILMRRVGQFLARMRSMAMEFRASFDEMARQSELDELRREVEAMRRGQFADQAAAVNAEASQIFNEIGDSLNGSGVQFHPPMSHQTTIEVAEPVAESPASEAKPRARRARREPTVVEPKAAKPRAKKAAAKTSKTAKATAKRPATRRAAKPKAGSPA